jgi:hypothetical protein
MAYSIGDYADAPAASDVDDASIDEHWVRHSIWTAHVNHDVVSPAVTQSDLVQTAKTTSFAPAVNIADDSCRVQRND